MSPVDVRNDCSTHPLVFFSLCVRVNECTGSTSPNQVDHPGDFFGISHMGRVDTAVCTGESGRQEDRIYGWEGRGDRSEVRLPPLSTLLLFTRNNQSHFPLSYDWNSVETS